MQEQIEKIQNKADMQRDSMLFYITALENALIETKFNLNQKVE